MNIFATEQGILGDTDYARQHNTFQAFLTLARSIRKRLGARAYKLDEYIRQLLIACSIPLEEEFFDREDSATNALAASCRMVAKGGGQKSAQANGCYSIVRAYAQAHPLQNQVDNTRSLIYFCSLLDDYLAMGIPSRTCAAGCCRARAPPCRSRRIRRRSGRTYHRRSADP